MPRTAHPFLRLDEMNSLAIRVGHSLDSIGSSETVSRTERAGFPVATADREIADASISASVRVIERDLAPLRSFIDDQMIDNILGVLQIELARVNAGREPRNSEVAEFLIDVQPSDLLRLIRAHPMMRGLESLTTSERRVLRWCEMLSRAL